HIATLDSAGTRLGRADVLVRDGRIAAIGPGLGAKDPGSPFRVAIDGSRSVALPGLVNTHHHLFQVMTRNAPAAQADKLFDWLVTLYPIWRGLDAETLYWSTLAGAAELLLTGCTTTTDHHYLFPRDSPPDLLDAQIEAMERIGIRAQ